MKVKIVFKILSYKVNLVKYKQRIYIPDMGMVAAPHPDLAPLLSVLADLRGLEPVRQGQHWQQLSSQLVAVAVGRA